MLQVIHLGQTVHVPGGSGALYIGTLQVGDYDLLSYMIFNPYFTTKKHVQELTMRVTKSKDEHNPDKMDMKG
jgi:hypothetical protein